MISRRRRFSIGLLAACAALASTAPSANAAVHLSWEAPAGCPQTEGLGDRVQQLVHGSSTAAARELSAQATVSGHGTRWQVDLSTQLNGQRGHRVLKGESCAAVTDAAVFILAITLDPGLAVQAPITAPAEKAQVPTKLVDARTTPSARRPDGKVAPSEVASTQTPTESAAAREPAPAAVASMPAMPPLPAREPSSPRRVAFRLGVGAGFSSGTVPGAAPDVEVSGGMGLPWFLRTLSVELFLRGTWPRSTGALGDAPWVTATVTSIEAGGGPCAGTDWHRVALRLCGVVGVQHVRGEATGVSTPETGSANLVVVGGRVAIDLRLTPAFTVGGGMDALARPATPSLVVEGLGTAWTLPAAMLRAGLAAGWSF